MKIVCSKSKLVAAINAASKATAVRTSSPLLACLLLEAKDGKLYVTGNNHEVAIRMCIEAAVEEEGVVAVEAKFFGDVVRSIPDNKDVTIIRNGNSPEVLIAAGRANTKIAGLDKDGFVDMPEIKDGHTVELSASALREAVNGTAFCADKTASNKLMTGLYLEFVPGKFSVTSLDGHRIATVQYETDAQDTFNVLIPVEHLLNLTRTMPTEAETLKMVVTADHVAFYAEGMDMVATIIEGSFFDYKKMLAEEAGETASVTLSKAEFMNTLERSLLFVRAEAKKPVILEKTGDACYVSINTTLGNIHDQMEQDVKLEGSDITIGFNPEFVLEVLRTLKEESVCIRFISSRQPFFIKDDKGSYNYLMLPVTFTKAAS